MGRVLQTLDDLGVANNTVVVFASDNGWHMREHGSPSAVQQDGEKRSAYEASIRVPFSVRDPRGRTRGATIDANILNIDLAPTLLELAGLIPPSSIQNKSVCATP